LNDRVSLRRVAPADAAFLMEVYASTRADELALVDWDHAQKTAFVTMQFDAQDRHYRSHYSDATFDVIMVGDRRAGRLYVARWPTEIRIIDIALLPEWRHVGIGRSLLEDLLKEAQAGGKTVTIHVEHANPARPLYDRLGFSAVEDRGAYVFMEWRPLT
jgi:ribosomal protein S18 acetylase RimI-like enzyme